MSDFKKAYQLVKFGISIKKQFGFAIFFALIGIVVEIATKGTQIVGSFYIILSGMFIFQTIISSDVSTLVQSSPHKRRIQVLYPLMATLPWVYLTLTIVSFVHAYFASHSADGYATQCNMMLILGVLMFILFVYFGVAYKFFMASMVMMLATVYTTTYLMLGMEKLFPELMTNFGLCVLIAYGLTTLGAVLCYVLMNVLYKKPLSKWAFRGMLGEGKGVK
ncbi:MAG: hypothetical protein K6G07_04100 [Lachnospiraceae bacterium]|nr:hypothetical protein [Lachnospiraceae bacterium]